jgi:hypothetical protein
MLAHAISNSLVIIVVGWWALGVPTGKKRGDVVLGRFGSSTLGSFPIQIFAYTCAQNVSFRLETCRFVFLEMELEADGSSSNLVLIRCVVDLCVLQRTQVQHPG